MQTSLALAAERMAANRAAEVPSSGGSVKRRMLGGLAHSLGGTDETSSRLAFMGGDDGGGPDFRSETSLLLYSASEGSTVLFAQRRLGELRHARVTRIKEQHSSVHGETAVQDHARRVVTFHHEVTLEPSTGIRSELGVEQDMKTLAVALVSLLEGSLGLTSILPVARYKAVVESVQSGLWDFAAEFEAVPVQEGGLTA